MTHHPDFSDDELATLRSHGIVLFCERVIFDAQPPLDDARIAAIEAQCAGRLPDGLRALWRLTAGGRLDYDLSLQMDVNQEALSWNELFYDGSDGYHDLQGWIDHELEAAEQAAEDNEVDWDGKLTYLPFGGFEYLDRIYVVVDALHPEYGSVLAWKKGLPAAWRHRLHHDSIATIADNLAGAFAALHLEEDPLAPAGDYFTGQDLLEYLDERHESHGLPLELSDKLVGFYRRAQRDWRGALAAGALDRDGELAQIALRHAVQTDDGGLVAQLAEAGVDVGMPLSGSAGALSLAVGRGAWHAAGALLDAKVPVPDDALADINQALAPELTERLLAGGATPTAQAMAQCVACGAPASARVIGDALRTRGPDAAPAFETARAELLNELETALAKVQAGQLGHYLGAEGLMTRAAHLREFVW